jgi:hypothetical protein
MKAWSGPAIARQKRSWSRDWLQSSPGSTQIESPEPSEADMLTSISLIAAGLVASGAVGAIAGALAARRVSTHRPQPQHDATAIDPFTAAELDRAAADWATAQRKPEAAGVVADKLHLLHHLGMRRRGWQ